MNLRRRLALAIAAGLPRLFPRHMRGWGEAMAFEIAAIGCDRQALRFAGGCLRTALVQALLFDPAADLPSPSEGPNAMKPLPRLLQDPLPLGIACAVLACGLGLAYLSAAGAPTRYIAVNASALAIGLGALGAVTRMPRDWASLAGFVALGFGAAMLATALMGTAVDGAARWIRIGALTIQPSLVLLPPLLVLFACRRDLLSAAGVLLAAAAVAIQPDRAMAGALLAGVLAIAGRGGLLVLLASAAAFGATLLRPDRLPAVPFVDRVFYSSFDLHPAMGAGVVAGALLLLLPAIAGALGDAQRRASFLAFGAAWLAISIAAALGNYPTPVVGYGGSAIVGYLLSLACLPRSPRRSAAGEPAAALRKSGQEPDRTARAVLA